MNAETTNNRGANMVRVIHGGARGIDLIVERAKRRATDAVWRGQHEYAADILEEFAKNLDAGDIADPAAFLRAGAASLRETAATPPAVLR